MWNCALKSNPKYQVCSFNLRKEKKNLNHPYLLPHSPSSVGLAYALWLEAWPEGLCSSRSAPLAWPCCGKLLPGHPLNQTVKEPVKTQHDLLQVTHAASWPLSGIAVSHYHNRLCRSGLGIRPCSRLTWWVGAGRADSWLGGHVLVWCGRMGEHGSTGSTGNRVIATGFWVIMHDSLVTCVHFWMKF